MVEAHDDVAAPAAERYPGVFPHPFFGVGDCRFGGGLRTGESARNQFVDELSRGWCIFVHPVPRRAAGSRSRAAVRLFFAVAFDGELQRSPGFIGARDALREGHFGFVGGVRYGENDLFDPCFGRGIGVRKLGPDLLSVDRPTELGVGAVPDGWLQSDRVVERYGAGQTVVFASDRYRRSRYRQCIDHLHLDCHFVRAVLVFRAQSDFVCSGDLLAEFIDGLIADRFGFGGTRTAQRPEKIAVLGRLYGGREFVFASFHDLQPVGLHGERDQGRQQLLYLDENRFDGRAVRGGYLQVDVVAVDAFRNFIAGVEPVGELRFGRDDFARFFQFP